MSVGWVLDFVDNHGIRFVKYFRIRELAVPDFKEESKSKTRGVSSYFKTLKEQV
jgi:hypothetical protein